MRRSALLGIGFATGLVALVAAAPQSPTSQTQPPATPPATPPVTAPPTTTAPQTPAPPAAPATPPPAAEPRATGPPVPRTFTSDAGIIFSAIKPEKAADFEAVMARVKDALAKSTNPKRKQQAAAWRVFKSVEPGPGRQHPLSVVLQSTGEGRGVQRLHDSLGSLSRGSAGAVAPLHRLLRRRPDARQFEAGGRDERDRSAK